MAYQYTEFDGVPLPLYDHKQPHDPMPAESTLLDSIGGAWDWRGTNRRAGRRQTISAPGKYFGDVEYLVDDSGDVITDENSDSLIVGDGPEYLAAQVRALEEKIGIRGSLWRKRLDDDVLQWKTARLLAVQWPRRWDDHAVVAEVTPLFETRMEFWHAETVTSTSGSATAATPLPLLVNNTGQIADDAVITVTRTSGTITAFTLTGSGVSLSWSGSLGSGEVLTIDCGAQTVKEGTTNSYSGFSLGSAHTAAGWLPLAQGANLFMATTTGGNATIAIKHYNQYP